MHRASGFKYQHTPVLWAGFSLVFLLACKSGPGPQAPAAAPPAEAASAPEAAPPLGPADPIQITVAGPYVTSGSDGNQASVSADESSSIQWSIAGGAITSDPGSASITYSVGDPGQPLRLFCRIRDEKGRDRSAFQTQAIVFPPSLEDFKAVPEKLTAGTQGTLQWTAKEIKTLTLDPGGQDVSKVGSIPIHPDETTTYTIRAENLAGTAVTQQVAVTVVPPPVIKSFQTSGPVPVGQPITLIAEFSGGHAEIKQGDASLGKSDSSPLSVQVTAADKATFTLTVTNEAGTSISRALGFSFTSAYK